MFGTPQPYNAKLQNDLIGHNKAPFVFVSLLDSYVGKAAREWFSNAENIQWAEKVMNFYSRGVPSRTNPNSAFLHDDRFKKDCYFFFHACKYFKQFNFPIPAIQGNCGVIKEIITVLNSEKESVLQSGNGWVEQQSVRILNDLKADLELKFANMGCRTYLDQSEQLYQINTMTTVTDVAIQGSKDKQQDAANSNYAIYAIIAVIIIIIFIKLFRQ
ncbi:MAG: hypothetical protein IT251_04700 [Chitinophagaceae bacterium]|nr:hypothetical protein [Chitinophagaceae bacterium]